MWRLWALVLCVVVAGCNEYDLKGEGGAGGGRVGEIDVAPLLVEFGPAASDANAIEFFTVSNIGKQTLTVSDITLDPTEAFMLLSWPLSFELEGGESRVIEVAYTPMTSEDAGVVRVHSDDRDEPEVVVDLLGIGLLPELAIVPEHYAFAAGCAGVKDIELRNVGDETLIIDGISYDAGAELSLIDANVLPLVLEPGTLATVTVQYEPVAVGAVLGTLEVSSNDPAGPKTAEQSGETGTDVVDTFVVPDNPPVDILFAIDESCSMEGDARALGNAFDGFIGELDLFTEDWQIGVVLKDAGCFERGVITPTTPDYEAVFNDAVTGSFFSFGNDDLTEALLWLAGEALRDTDPGDCNEGFLRPDAALHIIAISDEPEQSGIVAEDWIDFYEGYVTDPSLLMVSGVIDVLGSCGEPGTGYIEAATLTGGELLDICNSNWGAYVAQLGTATGGLASGFELTYPADPATIEVVVDGQEMALGWWYDATRQEVVFATMPSEGIEVEITYSAVGC